MTGTLVGLWLFLAAAQDAAPEPRIEKLENGLRVVIVEDHGLPLASVQLWVRAGAAQDAPTQPGLCHLARTGLEHRDDLALKLRAVGVRFESGTLYDACYFSSLLPPAFLEFVLDREAARLRPLAVNQPLLKRMLAAARENRGACLDERPSLHAVGEGWGIQNVRGAGDPTLSQTARKDGALVVDGTLTADEALAETLAGSQRHNDSETWRALLAAAFPNHPYRNPPGLLAESLDRIEPEEIGEFLNRWFVPGNATLFVIGDVSPPRVLELVRQKFGPLPWREPPRKAEPEPPTAEKIRREFPNAAQTGLIVAWVTPPWFSFENTALDALMHRLCNEIDGPLAVRLAEQDCALVWRRTAWKEAGLLTLHLAPKTSVGPGSAATPPRAWPKESAAGLERIIFEELEKAAAATPTEIELNRMRAQATRAVLDRRASFYGRARLLAAHEIIGGDLWLASFEAARSRGVAPADLRRAAEILRRARTVVLEQIARPAAPAAVSPPQSLKRLDAAAALERLAQFAADVPPLAPPAAPPKVTVHKLASGARVTLCYLPDAPRACVRTFFPDSFQPYDPARAPENGGSRRHTPAEFRDYLSYHGLTFAYLGNEPPNGLEAHGPGEFLPQILELQAQSLRAPRPAQALAVGDFDSEAALTALMEWPAPPATAPQTPDSPPKNAASRPTPPAIFWMPGETESVELRIVWQPWESAPTDAGGLRIDEVAWLLGAPAAWAEIIDAEHAWRWRSRVLGENLLAVEARAPRAAAGDELRAILQRLAEIRENRVPPAQIQTVLRLARAARLIGLDSPDAIADVLQRGVREPWKIDAASDANALPPFAPASNSRDMLRIYAAGGGATPPESLQGVGSLEQLSPQP